MRRLLFAVGAALALLSVVPAPAAAADSGWSISLFSADLAVRSDGTLDVQETITAQFDVPKHGIVRSIPLRYQYDSRYDRVIRVSGVSVESGGGRVPYSVKQGDVYEMKIGDPNRALQGGVTYMIRYTVAGVLNGFPDHDELYWNVTGNDWAVPMRTVRAAVSLPGRVDAITCFQGPLRSTTPCRSSSAGDQATFAAGRELGPEEGLTVVTSMAKGAVPEPRPILERRPRSLAEMFAWSPLAGLLFGLALLLSMGLAAWIWWSHGRDLKAATSLETVVPEFEPPDGLRPAQVGLILDERANTLDITATVVDLAARGYLAIAELEPGGFLHSRHDYRLSRGKADPAQLQPFESTVWHALFDNRDEVKLSELRGTFKPKLDEAAGLLYGDAMRRRWFTHDPRWARLGWLFAGIGLVLLGILVAIALGQAAGYGLPGLGIALGGLVLTALHRWMPQRTATGRDLLMRTLGFRMYMNTAERYMQQFAEKERIFTAGLPYAIVFGCVDRWAHAFQGIDMAAATAGWYVGSGYFNPILFSAGLQAFSNTVGSSIAYVPAGSGGSGFGGGGFSGGGMGGGGGGSW